MALSAPLEAGAELEQTQLPGAVHRQWSKSIEADSAGPRSLSESLLLAAVPVTPPGGGSPPPVQPKLTMDRPGDRFERAADAAAKAALAMPVPAPAVSPSALGDSSSTPGVQRMCSKCAKALSGGGGELCPNCKAKLARGESLTAETGAPGVQREAEGAASAGEVPAAAASAVRGLSGGSPLPSSERAFFEPRYGVDLSPVRLHTGPPAASLASQLDARALTHRQHVVFGAGEYRPGTSSGRELLAHELAHVVQQGAVSAGSVPETPTPGVQRQPAPTSGPVALEAESSSPEVQRVKCDPDSERIDPALKDLDLYTQNPMLVGRELGIHPGIAHGVCCSFCGCTIAGWRERYLNRQVVALHDELVQSDESGGRVDQGLLRDVAAQMNRLKSYAGCYERILPMLLPLGLAEVEQSYIFSPVTTGAGLARLTPEVFLGYVRALSQIFGSVDEFAEWAAQVASTASERDSVIQAMKALVFGYGQREPSEIPRQQDSLTSSVNEAVALKLSQLLGFLRRHADQIPERNSQARAFANDFIKRPDSLVQASDGGWLILEAKHPWLKFNTSGAIQLDVDTEGIRPAESIPERREQLEAYRTINPRTALLTEQTCGCNLLAAFGGDDIGLTNDAILTQLQELRRQRHASSEQRLGRGATPSNNNNNNNSSSSSAMVLQDEEEQKDG
ncbi:MAG: DUF4157 domain-containing protein [Acidobacteriota bacterium]